MKRFLTTTALALTIGTGAFAEAHGMDWSKQVEATDGQFYGSDLIGMRIWRAEPEMNTGDTVADGSEQEWDNIGEINDLIITQDGEVHAVILGIGGFLGIGERDVAIQMDRIKVLTDDGDPNDRFLVVNATKEDLEMVPEFDREATQVMKDEMAAAENSADQALAETEQAAKQAQEATEETMAEKEAEAEKEMAEAEAATEEQMAETENAVSNADMEVPPLVRPEVEREGYAEVEMVDATTMKVDELTGARVYGLNDEDVGEVSELIAEDGKLTRAVIDVGGFLGLGEKPVAVDFDKLQILKGNDDGDLRVYIDSTEEALEAQPEYEG